jgi:hypothetical protein
MKDNLCFAIIDGDKITQYENCEIKSISANCNKCDFHIETTSQFNQDDIDYMKLHLKKNPPDHIMKVSYDMKGKKKEGPDIAVEITYK